MYSWLNTVKHLSPLLFSYCPRGWAFCHLSKKTNLLPRVLRSKQADDRAQEGVDRARNKLCARELITTWTQGWAPFVWVMHCPSLFEDMEKVDCYLSGLCLSCQWLSLPLAMCFLWLHDYSGQLAFLSSWSALFIKGPSDDLWTSILYSTKAADYSEITLHSSPDGKGYKAYCTYCTYLEGWVLPSFITFQELQLQSTLRKLRNRSVNCTIDRQTHLTCLLRLNSDLHQ
jgi:hypothetical protein